MSTGIEYHDLSPLLTTRGDVWGQVVGDGTTGPSTGCTVEIPKPNNEPNHQHMLFLSYWKLNESLATKRIQEIAEKLTTEGIFPPEGVEIIRWDGTPDGWGIVLWEADEFSQIQQGLAAWRVAAGDEAFFEKTMTAPAAPVQETIAEQAEFLAQFE